MRQEPPEERIVAERVPERRTHGRRRDVADLGEASGLEGIRPRLEAVDVVDLDAPLLARTRRRVLAQGAVVLERPRAHLAGEARRRDRYEGRVPAWCVVSLGLNAIDAKDFPRGNERERRPANLTTRRIVG